MCEVWRPFVGQATLLISEPVTYTFDPEEPRAVLRHESGHIVLRAGLSLHR
jgi:Zn-dependent protease with chaperone function